MSIIGKKGRSLSWNYRVVRELIPQPATETEEYHSIREIYYDADDKIEMWSEDPVYPGGETLEELRQDLGHMLAALEQSVIEMSDLPGAK